LRASNQMLHSVSPAASRCAHQAHAMYAKVADLLQVAAKK
jgi:hypothetical protein